MSKIPKPQKPARGLIARTVARAVSDSDRAKTAERAAKAADAAKTTQPKDKA